MDLTPIFKASVKTVKLRNKITTSALLGEKKPSTLESSSSTSQTALDKNRILQRQKKLQTQNDEFSKLAKDICHKITELRNLLIENRAAYMKFAQYLKSSAQMTDEQRDIIDRESEKFINYYTQYIGQIRLDWKHRHKEIKEQHKEHIENVIELLMNYLRSINKLHLDLKKYRMQHELETYRLLKLASNKKLIPKRPGGINNDDDDEMNKKQKQQKISETNGNQSDSGQENYDNDDDEKENKRAVHSNDSNKIRNDNSKTKRKSIEKYDGDDNDSSKKLHTTKQIALDDDANSQKIYEVNELSPEDIQMFESENNQLYQELQGLAEEVEQIEKNVVDIARLQEVFTEKVSLQKYDIERIATAVVGATENVKDANEQIKQAIQRNAGLRVWTLFFLLVMSFTLLFLDWYND